jgi:hypothetical protein
MGVFEPPTKYAKNRIFRHVATNTILKENPLKIKSDCLLNRLH